MHSHGQLDGLTTSAVFLQIFSPEMVDDPQTIVTPLLQLGAAIMLDKPLLVIVRPQDEPRLPERLRRAADRVVVTEADAGSEASAARILLALKEMGITPRQLGGGAIS